MDIFGFNLQELYFSLMAAIAAFVLALVATWLTHRSDKHVCHKRPNKRRNKPLR